MAQKRTFESLYAELEDTTRRLEQGNMPLDESLKLYEKGAALVEELRTILDEAELHVETLRVRIQPSVEPGPPGSQSDDGAPSEPPGFDDDWPDREYADE